MDIQFAGSDTYQSGQRVLGSSDPRLIRHVASCETVGGGIALLPAGKDEKLPQVRTESAESRVSRGCSPLLDSYKNNRHSYNGPEYYRRPVGRGKHCGRFSIRGVDPSTGKTVVRRVHCKSWTCSYCGPRRASLSKRRICEAADKLGLNYFWTLTLPVGLAPDPITAVRTIRRSFNHLRQYLRREFGECPRYICVLEFTQRGVPHLHVLFDRYIDHHWMSQSWSNLGAGFVVWVKRVTVQRVARYLSKYLTKDLFESAPKGVRRITTSRDIHLFEKLASPFAWEFVRESVWQLLEHYSARFFELQPSLFFAPLGYRLDAEGFLLVFEVAPDRELSACGITAGARGH